MEILVVNNNCSDQTDQVIRDYRLPIRRVLNPDRACHEVRTGNRLADLGRVVRPVPRRFLVRGFCRSLGRRSAITRTRASGIVANGFASTAGFTGSRGDDHRQGSRLAGGARPGREMTRTLERIGFRFLDEKDATCVFRNERLTHVPAEGHLAL